MLNKGFQEDFILKIRLISLNFTYVIFRHVYLNLSILPLPKKRKHGLHESTHLKIEIFIV